MSSEDDVDVVDKFAINELSSGRLVAAGELVQCREDTTERCYCATVDVQVERIQQCHGL